MRARTLVVLASTLAIAGLAGLGIQPQEGTSASAANTADPLANLAFLQGVWQSEEGGELTEETWSAPHKGQILGMFRWAAADGAVRLYELLAIGAEADATRLRLRHFSGKLVGWKNEADTNSAATLVLRDSTPTTAVFENEDTESELKGVTYTAVGKEGLKIEVRFRDPQAEVLVFDLKKPTGGAGVR